MNNSKVKSVVKITAKSVRLQVLFKYKKKEIIKENLRAP